LKASLAEDSGPNAAADKSTPETLNVASGLELPSPELIASKISTSFSVSAPVAAATPWLTAVTDVALIGAYPAGGHSVLGRNFAQQIGKNISAPSVRWLGSNRSWWPGLQGPED